MVDDYRVPEPRTSLDVESTSMLVAWIEAGWRRDEGLRRRWDYWRDMLVGEFRRQGVDGGALKGAGVDLDKMTINLVYLHARTLLPTLFAQDPYVDALPPTDADAPNAPVWEALINHTIPLIRYKREIKRIVMDAITFGEGWDKWGWSGRTRPSQKSKAPPSPTVQPTYQRAPASDFISQALSLAGYQVGEPIGGGPAESPSRARRIEPSTGESGADPVSWLLKDGPFCVRMAPHDVVVDPLSPDRDPQTARFIAIRYLKPISEVKATPGYKLPTDFVNKRTAGFSGGAGQFNYAPWSMTGERAKLDTERTQDIPEHLGMCVLWEVWVLRLVDLGLYRQVITLVEGCERPVRMVSWEDMLGTDEGNYPIHRLAFNEVPDEPPMSEFEAWAPMQDMLNWLVRKALANVNRFPRQSLVNEKALVNPATSIAAIEKGTDGYAHKVKGADLTQVIAPVEYPSAASNDANGLVSFLWDSIQAISGISENRKGQAASRTATEAKIIEGGSAVREQEKQTVVQDFCEEGINTLISLFQAFVDRDYVIRRVGAGGAIQWMKFGPAQLSGEIPAIKIRFDSTKFSNDQKELQKWSAALQWAVQLKPFVPNIRLDLMAGYAMRKLGIENVAESMGNPLSPLQREQQWLEIAQMQQGIPMPINEADSHALHMEVTQEFRNTPAYGAMAADPMKAMALQMIEMHDQEHAQALQRQTQAQMAAQPGQEMAPEMPSGNEESPANQARGDAQSSMPELPALAGASNEL